MYEALWSEINAQAREVKLFSKILQEIEIAWSDTVKVKIWRKLYWVIVKSKLNFQKLNIVIKFKLK